MTKEYRYTYDRIVMNFGLLFQGTPESRTLARRASADQDTVDTGWASVALRAGRIPRNFVEET